MTSITEQVTQRGNVSGKALCISIVGGGPTGSIPAIGSI